MPDLNEPNNEQQESQNSIISTGLEKTKGLIKDQKKSSELTKAILKNNQTIKVTIIVHKNDKLPIIKKKSRLKRVIKQGKQKIKLTKKQISKIKRDVEEFGNKTVVLAKNRFRKVLGLKRKNDQKKVRQELRADSKSQNNIQGTKQSTDQPKVNVQKKQLKKEQLKKVAEETKKGNLVARSSKDSTPYSYTAYKDQKGFAPQDSVKSTKKKWYNIFGKGKNTEVVYVNPTKGVGKKGGFFKNFLGKAKSAPKFLDMAQKLSPKGQAKEAAMKMLGGRDEKGDLTIIGILITLIFLVITIKALLIIAIVIVILAIILVVISVVLAIWTFIVALFTLKTEDMAIAEAFEYISYLDASKNRDVYNRYNQLVEEHDEVYFEVNGMVADPEQFSFASNGDNYIYYLNAKYENYNIKNSALPNYLKRLKDQTSMSPPLYMSFYAQFKDKYSPMEEEPVKIAKVEDELRAIHDGTFTYKVEFEEDKDTEEKVKDKEEEDKEEKDKDSVTLNVKVQTIAEFLDLDPQIELYSNNKVIGTISAFSQDEIDKYYPVLEIDRFQDKIFMDNPLGKVSYASVIGNYGYRGRDDANMNDEIIIDAKPQTPVYATSNEKVTEISMRTARDLNGKKQTTTSIKTETGKYQAYYINVTPIIREGASLESGDLIGYTSDKFDGNLLMIMKEKRIFLYRNPEINPTIFIENLVYGNRTKLSQYDREQSQGELIYPPEKVVQWREKVVTEAKKQNIESFTNVILSIIWVESGGDGETVPDIMGIAKAQNLNQTINPEKSIELGVAYFANLIRKAQMYQLGNLAAIQAYNYGEDYLDELIRTDSKYTFEHSKAYAQERSNGEVVSYNKGVALDLGYNWRYAFGDMFYARLISYNLSNSTGKLVEVATKEIGTLNGNKYWEWAGYESRMEWSAIFVTWVAEQAGYLSQGRVPNTVRPLDMFNWYKKNNKFKATDIGYIPQPGDLIFFDWKGNKTGKDQVGIVEFTGGNTIQVIEGNSENMVRRRTYTLDHSAISGYGVP